MIQFTHVGLNNMVCANRILAIIPPGTVTANRYKRNAKEIKKFIDATYGKTIESYLLMDEGTVVASHISVKTLVKRLSNPVWTNQQVEEYDPNMNPAPYGIEREEDEELEELGDLEEDDDEV